jgi:hypothetical protein
MGDAGEQALKVALLLDGELCRIDYGVRVHAEDPLEATRRARGADGVFLSAANLGTDERAQTVVHRSDNPRMGLRKEYDWALHGAWDELDLRPQTRHGVETW